MPPKRRRRQWGTGSIYQRRSDGRWLGKLQAGWTPTGTRRVITVSATTQAEAKRRLEELRRQIARDGLPETGTTRTTVKAWAETWLPMHAATVRPKAYTTDAGNLTRWIIPTIGHRRLADLTPGDIRAVHRAITTPGTGYPHGRSRYVARQAHWTLMGMLKAAVLEGHQVPQRVLLVKAPAQVVSDRDAIPLDDVKALLRVLDSRLGDVRWVAALLHGMRQGEVLGLTWDAIDFDRSRIDVSWQLQTLPYLDPTDRARGFRVPQEFEARHLTLSYHLTRPKTHAGTRIVPLMPWMADALAQWQRITPDNPWGLVWSVGGSPVSPRADRKMWVNLQKAAGVSRPDGTPYTLHEARHTAASLMLAAGVDAKVVSELMGHSTVAMSRAYQHAGDQLKLDAFEAVSRRLGIEN